ncbi:MAG: methyltransferase regulatory domain-containing protein [Pirellulales bacterium]
MSSRVSELYDELPFLGDAVPHAHSGFMEVIGRVRGMQPAAAAEASVLELGCGVGENLLPMAERYPGARLVGVDLSERQIAMGQSLARDCGLANVELQHGDITALGPELGTFDYVLCHGVYSWVEAPVRDALLRACRDHLAPQGLVYIGYKTYPGWHVHDMIRALMFAAARGAVTPREQIAKSRAMFDVIRASLPPDRAYHTLLRTELDKLAAAADDYLFHEYLETTNHPVYVDEFLRHAHSHGLQYAGDGAIGVCWKSQLPSDAERGLVAITSDAVEQERFRDVMFNRAFRQTLLCHADVTLSHAITADRLRGLFLEGAFSPGRPNIDFAPGATECFVHRNGGRLSTSQRLLKAALLLLGQAWPGFVSFEDLVAACCWRVESAGQPPIDPAEVRQLEHSLADCCERPVIMLHSHAAVFASVATESPVASPLARVQARDRHQVSNRRHEPVNLNPLDRWLLTLLDGRLKRQQLIDHAAAAVASGRLAVSKQGQPIPSHDEALRFLGDEVPAALSRLTAAALLVG